jgi:Trp operon repressor
MSSSFRDLCKLFASVQNEREAKMLLEDILTPRELDSVMERWQLVQALAKGMTQRDVKKKFNISISKVTRGSNALHHGSGGFDYFLRKLKITRRAPPAPRRSRRGR